MSINIKQYEAWFVTGSQHLYGEETLKTVADNARQIAEYLDARSNIPVRVVVKPVQTTPEDILKLCREANSTKNCIGLITWMHTFSPAKMWIAGLKSMSKPFVHLHTQFNVEIPWDTIDMDFMNLNQSAHGGREFGFMATRMRLERKVIVGHWKDEEVINRLAIWMRVASAWNDMQGAKVARFGDNMREVAVTEGDKVEAQLRFGYDVYGYGVGDLVKYINDVPDKEITKLISEYKDTYAISVKTLSDSNFERQIKEAAKIELGMNAFLLEGSFTAFTTTFEDLHGLGQLPGLAVQRLMEKGYGFGAEGDWKTAALLRAIKVMGAGFKEGASFMEDYTYHLEPGNMKVLGAHMLEVCPSIANDKPSLEIHPLSIGGKEDPARLVFRVSPGRALNASIMDMGNRFRLLVNEVEVVEPKDLPKLPVARALWMPQPSLKIAAEAWILAGGAHHTCFSKAITSEYMEDFASMAGIEYVLIDAHTEISHLKKEMRWNDMYYMLSKALYK